MTLHARGDFEVSVTPTADTPESAASMRLSIVKKFTGDFVGTGRGEMWTADTHAQGSGGYVAIEKVEGTLHGKSGSFIMMHQGTMRAGANFDLRIVIVPDSGKGEMASITGTAKIIIADGKHSYEFDYQLD